MIAEIVLLVIGIALLLFSSDKTVGLASDLARDFGVSPFLVGILVLAAGTSIPEIANSVAASYAGHGEMNVGNAFGSCLSQITLVLGMLALMGGKKIVGGRKDILLLGGCAILAGMLALAVAEKGSIDRMDALLLIVAYFILLFITQKYSVKEYSITHMPRLDMHVATQLGVLLIAVAGVLAGAWMIVNSAISISESMGVDTYLISFFVVALGTSLPELSVGLAAVRRGKFELVIGNILGSNIADSTLSIASGPLLFPNVFDAGTVTFGGEYMLLASFIVVGLFAWKMRITKWMGLAFIGLYLLSFILVPGLI